MNRCEFRRDEPPTEQGDTPRPVFGAVEVIEQDDQAHEALVQLVTAQQ